LLGTSGASCICTGDGTQVVPLVVVGAFDDLWQCVVKSETKTSSQCT
jgi:hypothetical protein